MNSEDRSPKDQIILPQLFKILREQALKSKDKDESDMNLDERADRFFVNCLDNNGQNFFAKLL